MLALWPAELTARLFQHPDQDSGPGLLVRTEVILLFTIRARAEGKGFRTLIPLRGTALAGRLGEPYPTTFHVQWTHRESNRSLSAAPSLYVRWTMGPSITDLAEWTAGSRTPISGVRVPVSSRWTSKLA